MCASITFQNPFSDSTVLDNTPAFLQASDLKQSMTLQQWDEHIDMEKEVSTQLSQVWTFLACRIGHRLPRYVRRYNGLERKGSWVVQVEA